MVNSNLRRIIKRLEAMVVDGAGPLQVRPSNGMGLRCATSSSIRRAGSLSLSELNQVT